MFHALGTPCYLGNLAPELVDAILAKIDSVATLSNFITTSHFVNQRFKVRKRAILFRVLQNELGPVLADARFLFLFSTADPKESGYHGWVYKMAAVYRDMLKTGGRGRPEGLGAAANVPPTLEELIELCRTLGQINFLANIYIAVQLRSFHGGERTPDPTTPVTAPPSLIERLRIVRAFYRRQIVSNAHAQTGRSKAQAIEDLAIISNTSDHQGSRLGLFAAFKPWELQQIDHADHFITRLCAALRIVGEEAAKTTRPTASQAVDRTEYSNIFSHIDYLVRYIHAHPDLADHALLNLPLLLPYHPNNQHLNIIPRRIDSTLVRPCALRCLTESWQEDCCQYLPDPVRDALEGDGTKHIFVGDALNLTPFGWIDALDGRYTGFFGEGLELISPRDMACEEAAYARCVNSELWRGAGFALWDQGRVEAIKRLDQLKTVRTGWALD